MLQNILNSPQDERKTLPRPQVYSVDEVCAILKISIPHFYTLKNKGIFKPIKLGRRTLVPVKQVDELLASTVAK